MFAGLLKKEIHAPLNSSVILGVNDKKSLIVDESNENILLIGSPRSGKGVSTVIPSALVFEGTSFFLDQKGEIFKATSDYREKILNHEILLFNPFSNNTDTLRWNPLNEIRFTDEYLTSDLRIISCAVISNKTNTATTEAARNLFEALILLAFHNNAKKKWGIPSLVDLLSFFNDGVLVLQEDILCDIKKSDYITADYLEVLNNYIVINDYTYRKEVSSIIYSDILFVNNTFFQKNLTISDFSINDLFHRNTKVSFYFCFDIAHYYDCSVLANIFFSQLYSRLSLRNTDSWEKDKDKRYLIILDEFFTINKISNMGTFLRSAKEHCTKTIIVCHNVEFLKRIYSPSDSEVENRDFCSKNNILSNCDKYLLYPGHYISNMTLKFYLFVLCGYYNNKPSIQSLSEEEILALPITKIIIYDKCSSNFTIADKFLHYKSKWCSERLNFNLDMG